MNQTPKVEKKTYFIVSDKLGESVRPFGKFFNSKNEANDAANFIKRYNDSVVLDLVNEEYVSQLEQEKQDLIDALKKIEQFFLRMFS